MLTIGGITLMLAIVVFVVAFRAKSQGNTEGGRVDSSSEVVVSESGSGVTRTGGKAPTFSITTLSGSRFSFPAGKPAAVFFVAADCGSCIPESQAWNRIVSEYGDRVAVLVVGSNPSDSPAALNRFMRYAVGEPRFEVALDPTGKLVDAFRVGSLDTTVVVDAAGTVVFRDAVPTPEAELRQALRAAGVQ
jgi:cytochrome c biogenesis protein CcmG/thiol:disulfide interchange protein DsbE